MSEISKILDSLLQVAVDADQISKHPNWKEYGHGWMESLEGPQTLQLSTADLDHQLHVRLRAIDSALRPRFAEPVPLRSTEREREVAKDLLGRLVACVLVDLAFGLDYVLELRFHQRLVSSTLNAAILHFLISIVGEDASLDRENHGFGYHFHYALLGQVPIRTNVLLAFDPQEPLGPPDSLYWSHHGPGVRAEPAKWGSKRRLSIHTAARPSLSKPGKSVFQRRGRKAKLLART